MSTLSGALDLEASVRRGAGNIGRSSSSLTDISSSPQPLRPLPPDVLLLTLPSLLAHPPNHELYPNSLVLSLAAFRKCLYLVGLEPESECRAWAGLVEVGMRAVDAGYHLQHQHAWASDIIREIEQALTKGLLLASKHPSLRGYWHHLSLLQASFAHRQGNTKFARKLLSRTLKTLKPSDPALYTYSIRLAELALFFEPLEICTPSTLPTFPLPHEATLASSELSATLGVIALLRSESDSRKDTNIALFSMVLHLRALVAADMWDRVGASLRDTELALGLVYAQDDGPKQAQKFSVSQSDGMMTNSILPHTKAFEDPFEAAMAVVTLIIGTLYWTHLGVAAKSVSRMSHLHILMDNHILERLGDGIIEVPLNNSPPIQINTTHPRIIFLLTYLVSATAKRDATGRNPKRKVFSLEGLRMWNEEAKRDITLALWSSPKNAAKMENTLVKIKADVLSELVAVFVMRSEFAEAEKVVNELIAFTRTYNLFDTYAPRIALHHAHLAHARGDTIRANSCYVLASDLSPSNLYVSTAARAGQVACAIGVAAQGSIDRDGLSNIADTESVELGWAPNNLLCSQAREVAKECRSPGLSGSLYATAEILEACASREIVRSKTHLKNALDASGSAQDNHARALILALVASHYMHTAEIHAEEMLKTSRGLASALGPQPEKGHTPSTSGQGPQPTGNAVLGLWVGQRFVEIYRRTGDERRAVAQASLNDVYASVIEGQRRKVNDSDVPMQSW